MNLIELGGGLIFIIFVEAGQVIEILSFVYSPWQNLLIQLILFGKEIDTLIDTDMYNLIDETRWSLSSTNNLNFIRLNINMFCLQNIYNQRI